MFNKLFSKSFLDNSEEYKVTGPASVVRMPKMSDKMYRLKLAIGMLK